MCNEILNSFFFTVREIVQATFFCRDEDGAIAGLLANTSKYETMVPKNEQPTSTTARTVHPLVTWAIPMLIRL